MSSFKPNAEFKSGSGGHSAGPYFFKIVSAESGKTAGGKPSVSFDLDLFDTGSKDKVGETLKYVSFLPEEDFGIDQLSQLVVACGKKDGYDSEQEMVGCGGIVIIGYNQNYKNPDKWYSGPANQKSGSFFNKEKFSPREITEKATNAEQFGKTLASVLEKPYCSLGWERFESKPIDTTLSTPASTPETDSDLPF